MRSATPRIRSILAIASLALLALLAGCTTPVPTGVQGQPVLVVAFTTNPLVRERFEKQLEQDLQAHDVIAVPSVQLIADFDIVTHDMVLRAARSRDATMILMVRRLITTLGPDATTPPSGIDTHRTLAAYFRTTDRNRLPDIPPPGRQVIEVDGYKVDGDNDPRLVWHGYTWVDFDGDLDAAIAHTADTIATNMAAAHEGINQAAP